MSTNRRALLSVYAALLTGPALAGCADQTGSTPTPTVTVTATATVNATPEPGALPRSFTDPIAQQDAWSLCWGAVFGQNSQYWTLESYSPEAPLGGPTVVDNGDGTFDVTVMWAPTSGEGFAGEAMCTVGGTVGAPHVELTGVRDYG